MPELALTGVAKVPWAVWGGEQACVMVTGYLEGRRTARLQTCSHSGGARTWAAMAVVVPVVAVPLAPLVALAPGTGSPLLPLAATTAARPVAAWKDVCMV